MRQASIVDFFLFVFLQTCGLVYCLNKTMLFLWKFRTTLRFACSFLFLGYYYTFLTFGAFYIKISEFVFLQILREWASKTTDFCKNFMLSKFMKDHNDKPQEVYERLTIIQNLKSVRMGRRTIQGYGGPSMWLYLQFFLLRYAY